MRRDLAPKAINNKRGTYNFGFFMGLINYYMK